MKLSVIVPCFIEEKDELVVRYLPKEKTEESFDAQ